MRILSLVAAIALAACAQHGETVPQAKLTGASSCVVAERQDISFSGAWSGHFVCSTSAAMCTKAQANAQGAVGVAAPLNARMGAKPVQLLIGFLHEQTGTYQAGVLGDEQGRDPQGVALDGLGHWNSTSGSMSLDSDDASGAGGTIDVVLTSGTQTIHAKGTWRCVKPPGF